MSYILDALKKLEREKSQKAQGYGTVNFSGELSKGEKTVSAKIRAFRITVILVICCLATAGGAWFLLKEHKATGKTNTMAANQSYSVIGTAPLSSSPKPPVEPVAPKQNPTTQPVPSGQVAVTNSALPQQSSVTPATNIRPSQVQPSVTKEVKIGSDRTVMLSVAPPVEIKVSGIAWQDDRSGRRAVINGMLLREGVSVLNARIVEIFQDRVRFSMSGSTFDVPLIASGLPGGNQK